jgi:DNA recombination-dependent growth factor C
MISMQLFHVPEGITDQTLQALQDEVVLLPRGLEFASDGFVQPLVDDERVVVPLLPTATVLRYCRHEKVLPPPKVIRAEAERRLRDDGIRPGSKAMSAKVQEVLSELVPRALVRTKHIDVLILNNATLAVLTPSRKAAERVISRLRQSLGSLPAIRAGLGISLSEYVAHLRSNGSKSVVLLDSVKMKSNSGQAVFDGASDDLMDALRAEGMKEVQVCLYDTPGITFALNSDCVFSQIVLHGEDDPEDRRDELVTNALSAIALAKFIEKESVSSAQEKGND